MNSNYKVIEGTSFHKNTPLSVCNILNSAMHNWNQKVRIFYGDTKTGLDWNESYDTFGFIGRSMGEVKIPLILYSKRSFGGSGILDDCIIRITIDKKDVYRHPSYCCGIERKGCDIYNAKGECIFCGRNGKTAIRWEAFFKGERNAH